jgi:hypothetical protein
LGRLAKAAAFTDGKEPVSLGDMPRAFRDFVVDKVGAAKFREIRERKHRELALLMGDFVMDRKGSRRGVTR